MKTKSIFFTVCIIACRLLPSAYSFAQGVWTQKADFWGTARQGATGFSIGNKGYIGTGNDGANRKDFWEWDQATDTWTQKSDFGGTGRQGAAGFSIGNKGYVGGGYDGSNRKDFWEWDQATNTWSQKADFGGTGRYAPVGFSIGTKGYMGIGGFGATCYQDFWEWDQATNTWSQKANFGGAVRTAGVGFSIGSKGYIGTGVRGNGPYTLYSDFREYDPVTDTWTAKANFPGGAIAEATAFTIGKYGYIGTGTTNIGSGSNALFWKYDPAANTWVPIPNFGGGIREIAVSFSIGCYGYVAAGFINDQISTMKKDLWEYHDTADTTCGCNITALVNGNITICSGENVTLTASGGTNYSWSNGQTIISIILTPTATTTYSVIVSNGSCSDTANATVTVAYSIITNQSASICQGSIYTLPGGTVVSTGGNYIDTIVSTSGCDSIITTILTVDSVLTSTQSASLCSGSTYTLPGGTVVSIGGDYIDTLTSVAGCDSIITTTLTVNSNPTTAVFSIPTMSGQVVTITQGQSVTLIASGGGDYTWSNGANSSSVIVTPLVTTVYCVTVTDANNCTDTACVTVTIELIDCSNTGEIYLPNAFSPNRDDENDVLKIYYGNMKCIKTFSFVIYNRWGEKVFTTNDPSTLWGGYYKGKLLNPAVFVYYMEATLTSGEKVNKKGNISLIR